METNKRACMLSVASQADANTIVELIRKLPSPPATELIPKLPEIDRHQGTNSRLGYNFETISRLVRGMVVSVANALHQNVYLESESWK